MIKVKKKRITFSKDLDVKFSGKQIKETEKEITLEGEDEESYLKIYNPFHRVAKLILYEDNTWVEFERRCLEIGIVAAFRETMDTSKAPRGSPSP